MLSSQPEPENHPALVQITGRRGFSCGPHMLADGTPLPPVAPEHQLRCDTVLVLPSDYQEYGGTVERWADPEEDYPDCSVGCLHFRPLHDETYGGPDLDWGTCLNARAPRAGLLTFEHQAGKGCFEAPPEPEDHFDDSNEDGHLA